MKSRQVTITMTNSSPEELLEASPLFDADWYQAQYPDVAALELSAIQHYLKYGWRLGRSPSASFFAAGYLDDNPDIRQASINPLLHYLLHGQHEGRQLRPVPATTLVEASVATETATPVEPSARQRTARLEPANQPPQVLADPPADEHERLSLQLSDTQQLLEHYFTRCQELEYQLMDGAV